jgi:phosphomethylpyrimidine synthase
MDLSTGGDLDACREAIIRNSTVPIGTVPIYSMIIGRRIEDLSHDWILETLEHQAKQGVDYFTVHAGVLKEHLPLIQDRLIGIVSRMIGRTRCTRSSTTSATSCASTTSASR